MLVVDGIFLHRDELVDWWDISVFLDVPFAETFRRMAVRDGCPPDPTDPANARYLEGQRLYLAQCAPQQRADVRRRQLGPAAPDRARTLASVSTWVDTRRLST